LKAIGFVAACSAAFPLSFFGSFALLFLSRSILVLSQGFLGPIHGSERWGGGRLDIPLQLVFMGGTVGAFVVLLAAFLLFASANITGRSTGRLILWSLIGGVLGVIGWVAPSAMQSQPGQNHQDPVESTVLYVVWQTGVALCVAFVGLAPAEQVRSSPSAAQPAQRSMAMKVTARVFFGGIFAFFAWQIYGDFHDAQTRARREAELRKIISETPSVQDLPPIEAMTAERAVIQEDIGGLLAQNPHMQNFVGAPGSARHAAFPPHVTYTLLYTQQKGPPRGSGGVTVTVDQYPNSAWSRYKAKYSLGSLTALSKVAVVTKFGKRIYLDSSQSEGGVLSFHWPCDTMAVTVRYEENHINEEFLKRYLNKYPSSL
jgi:hypothetical protein